MCPQCGGDTIAWLQRQTERLLPVPYFLVTFTMPEPLRELARRRPGWFYAALFDESARTLQDIAANPKHPGGELGFFGVLHTWSRRLTLHPPIHYIVAGGGLAVDHASWHSLPQPDFLLPAEVLAARFRPRPGARPQADEPALHAEQPSSVWRAGWVVDYAAVGSGVTALRYLSAYVFRTAFGGKRELTELPGRPGQLREGGVHDRGTPDLYAQR